ncbi:hypothetical protein [Streptomyces sp. NPDC091259]|uniref:hypothetical protein n=1 Tax=Streptomyces sp. NPDC091259 TaxID=3365976 RepID=UPI003814173C
MASLDRLFQSPPVPDPACDVCRANYNEWLELKNPRHPKFDPARAADVAIEIRRHPKFGTHK